MGDALLPAELSHVSVVLGGRTILRDVSLQVRPGEMLAVLGPNGAGKSTLLKVLLGLVRPASGEVRVSGRRPAQGRGDVGYCPQVRSLDRDTPLRAKDLVGLGLDGHRWGFASLPKPERERRIAEVMEAVDALRFAQAPVGQLSGGEQQRLAIAQALLARPRLLLMDEPLSNLDVRSQGEVIELVDRLRKQHGMAVLFVTHSINPLLGVIDKVCYLAGGRAAVGTVDQVVRSDVLSQLYDAPIEVLRVGGRIFVATEESLSEQPETGHGVEHV